MKRLLLLTAAFAAAMAGMVALLLPPPAVPAVASQFLRAWPVARGAYHVHSQRSDGTGTFDEIAAAAAAAGLQFVIVTDHGDGTRAPEPPAYRSGVLCIDGVEISTQQGHYVALALPRTPFPLAGSAREVIEDVRRFGGFGFAAHPGSPKPALAWTDWDARFDGIEWLNADSEWRDELWGSLGRVLMTYAFRPAETLAGVLDRPEPVLRHWDAIATERRVPALAGADAHARLGLRQTSDPYEDRVLARVPSYEVSFRAFSNHVVLDAALTGDAARDAEQVLSALREGRVFSSIDSFAGLGMFEAKATSGHAVARIGEYLDLRGPAVIESWIAAPEGTSLVVLRDGAPIYDTAANALRLDVGTEPGAYRIEARLPRSVTTSTAPWVLTNPFYIGLRDSHARAAAPVAPHESTARDGVATASWQPESSAGSNSMLAMGAVDANIPALEWTFALAGGARAQQFAAMRFAAEKGLAGHKGLQLRIRSDAPRRLWVQLRTGAGQSERWGKTFYVDEELQTVNLWFSEFRPLGPASDATPPLDRIDSILLVVDTLNTSPGQAGNVSIVDLWLVR